MLNLFSIVKYESLMLLRTWKFWILVIIGIFFPILINVFFIIINRVGVNVGWQGLEGAGPYVMFSYFNFFQIIIIIFLTGDFREKDSRAQVDEVMNSRSMTNLEYILGKYLGIIIPLVLLTLTVVLLLSFANRIVNDTWSLTYYFKFFLILNLPGLLFVAAFIIFISSLLRNSFVVFIFVLAYTIGMVILSYYKAFSMNQLWLFVDYVGFFLPLFSSDLTGVLNLDIIILQRVFYMFLGGFFMALTIVLFYPRLHQSKFWARATLFGGFGCLAAALLIFYNAWIHEENRKEIRNAALTPTYTTVDENVYSVSHYSLKYELFKDSIPVRATAVMTIHANNSTTNRNIPLVLNPGIKIDWVKDEHGRELSFEQNTLECIVTLAEPLQIGESTKITLEYQGDIDSRVIYLRRKNKDPGILDSKYEVPLLPAAAFENEPALLHRRYSYLLPESFWYPQLYNPYGFSYPDKAPVNFFTGDLSFDVPGDLTALAPGRLESVDSTTVSGRKRFHFTTSTPIKGIAFVAGAYKTYSMNVSGIDFQLYVSDKHAQIVEFFSEIKEDVRTIIADALRGIKEVTGLDYPYPSLTYVEVPLSIQWYQDAGLQSEAIAQAGMILLPEYTVAASYKQDFNRRKDRAERRGEKITDADIKKGIFIDVIVNKMFNNILGVNTIPTPLASFWSQRVNFIGTPYPIFEYYFDKFLQQLITSEMSFFITNQSSQFPFGDFGGIDWDAVRFQITYGISVDTMYQYVRTYSLSEMRPGPENDIFHSMMMFKGGKLNSILQEIITPQKYKTVLQRFLEEYAYKNATVKDFQKICEEVHGESLNWFFDSWLYSTAFPGYVITALDAYKLEGGKQGVQYLVDLRIKNGEKDPGFLKVALSTEGDQLVKRSAIQGNQELQFSFLSDEIPEEIIVDPIFSQNQNALRKKVRVPDDFDKRKPWDGIKTVNILTDEEEGIIIDDLDAGFKVIQLEQQQYLRPVRNQNAWAVRVMEDAFGKYKFTYRLKKQGAGLMPAQWETEIPAAGVYDVQVYIFEMKDTKFRRQERSIATKFKYTIPEGTFVNAGDNIAVNRDKRTGEILLEWRIADPGWNSLGQYYFEQGAAASVQLSDDADGRVIADAVRFVPVEPDNPPNKH